MPEKKDKAEVKYNPDYFIEDLTNLLESFTNKVRILDEIEFSTKQKAEIAGIMLGTAANFIKIEKKLREWGFLA